MLACLAHHRGALVHGDVVQVREHGRSWNAIFSVLITLSQRVGLLVVEVHYRTVCGAKIMPSRVGAGARVKHLVTRRSIIETRQLLTGSTARCIFASTITKLSGVIAPVYVTTTCAASGEVSTVATSMPWIVLWGQQKLVREMSQRTEDGVQGRARIDDILAQLI